MSLDSLTKWLDSFLKQPALSPDGRLLFSYDLSQDDYEAFRHELSGTIAAADGLESSALHSLGRGRLTVPLRLLFFTPRIGGSTSTTAVPGARSELKGIEHRV